ncbi:hypothetical protein BU24DRAFT_420440 [Aaosphaeria arxii CBS 175.79]|uniref:Uncharacterized protein n=1 Tax=Aaosphaeria arxii CBS 175.79 TaxID=1450172 RepID=A0A6A5XXL9_9PLEO|nr:uncharacterized protein BU24DRAFT_420440 [Aaosphaeria arxii CBS 175.79]KAF2017390.1 hypothetical protein BU24DRAFT_420440 [Aaosphaeria arxii CBS 175.79]
MRLCLNYYHRDLRVRGDPTSPLNGIYYFYAVDVKTLKDVDGYPLSVDGIPAENDPRRIFLGGLILQRPAVLQVGNLVYAGFGGLCEAYNYTGAVIAVDINTRKMNYWVTQAGSESVFTEDWTQWSGGGPGGIWQAGQGLASDGQDVFFLIDNGAGSSTTNVSTTPISGKTHLDVLSETAVRISKQNGSIRLLDWFRPFDWQSDGGQDIGSGGLAILGSEFSTSSTPKMGVVTSTNTKMYVVDLSNLGGYRQGINGTDGVVQTIPLDGEVFGGVGTYPHEGGYIYVNPGNSPLSAYRFNSSSMSRPFELAGVGSHESSHWGAVGLPTVTSDNGRKGSGIVWITEPTQGLFAYHAVPVNGTLTEIPLPKVEGAMKFGRPVFGDRRVYIVDGQRRLIALGLK